MILLYKISVFCRKVPPQYDKMARENSNMGSYGISWVIMVVNGKCPVRHGKSVKNQWFI